MVPLGAANILEDSVFTWRFNAHSGDSWGGTMIADSVAFGPGDSVQTAFGTYLIQLEQAFPVDLDSFGLHEGHVLVEWYWHRESGHFLPTRNGVGSIAGTDGLGSEQDAAWSGTGWVPFGLGGALVVGGGVAGNDRRLVTGGPGNDVFRGDLRRTTIDAGPGHDVVMYEGNLRSVVLTREDTDIWVAAPRDSAAFDQLRGVEEIRFADATLHFSVDATVAKVTRLYLAALGRAPEQYGLENWSLALDNGLDLRAAAGGFIWSPEFNARFGALDNAGFVERLYLNVLGRNSDPQGLANWLDALARGQSKADLLIGFAESAENRARTKEVVDAGIVDFNNTMAVVARLYNATLGRDPDLGGAENWARQISSGTPIHSIVPGFTGSPEFQARYGALPDRQFVEQLYRNTLFREADIPGLNNWIQAMSAGLSRADVVLGFSESIEHQLMLYGRWGTDGITFV
jgi:hypothetical protein